MVQYVSSSITNLHDDFFHKETINSKEIQRYIPLMALPGFPSSTSSRASLQISVAGPRHTSSNLSMCQHRTETNAWYSDANNFASYGRSRPTEEESEFRFDPAGGSNLEDLYLLSIHPQADLWFDQRPSSNLGLSQGTSFSGPL